MGQHYIVFSKILLLIYVFLNVFFNDLCMFKVTPVDTLLNYFPSNTAQKNSQMKSWFHVKDQHRTNKASIQLYHEFNYLAVILKGYFCFLISFVYFLSPVTRVVTVVFIIATLQLSLRWHVNACSVIIKKYYC